MPEDIRELKGVEHSLQWQDSVKPGKGTRLRILLCLKALYESQNDICKPDNTQVSLLQASRLYVTM
jgi:hypothetical protein